MRNWKIDIYLKNGVKLECVYRSAETTATDVLNKTFSGKSLTDVVGFDGRHGNSVYVIVGEVAAFDIYI